MITINRVDGIVGVDRFFLKVNVSFLPDNLRVVQWDGTTGHEEWSDQDNTELTDIGKYQVVLDAWEAKKRKTEKPLTDKDIQNIQRQELTTAIQSMLEEEAKKDRAGARYDDIKSARGQAGFILDGTETEEEVYIVMEARKLARWELKVWGKSLKIEKEVLAGTRPIPTKDELLAELPVFEG